MGFFDNWLAFNTCFDKGKFTAATQLVGYKLLAIDNERRHPESFLLTDRELMTRTGIKSGQTIVNARRQLKNAGLIDFRAKKGNATRYSIKQESSKNAESIKQDSSTNQAGAVLSLPSESKEEDLRKKTTPQPPLEVAVEAKASVTTGAQAIPLNSPENEANEIHEVWAYETGTPLTGSVAYELEQLAGEDFELTRQAIIAAMKTKTTDRLRYNLFRKVYDELKKSATAAKTQKTIVADSASYKADKPAWAD